jgi:hypothetical protein
VTRVEKQGKEDVKAMLEAAWARAGSGGYNMGCVLVTTPGGICIKRLQEKDIVPPGATTTDAGKEPNTQFCSSLGVLQYYSISFEQEALVHSCPLMGGLFYMPLNSLVDSDVLDLGASSGRRVIFLTLAVGFTLCGHVVCI